MSHLMNEILIDITFRKYGANPPFLPDPMRTEKPKTEIVDEYTLFAVTPKEALKRLIEYIRD